MMAQKCIDISCLFLEKKIEKNNSIMLTKKVEREGNEESEENEKQT